jgi:hypothetical protein
MQRGVIVAAAALSMPVAVGAHLLTASSPCVPVDSPGISAAKPAQKASLEIRQTPVPLQVKPHPPVKLPTVDTTEAHAKSETAPSQTSATRSAASSHQFSEHSARPALEPDRMSRGTVRIFVGDAPRAPDRRGASVEPDAVMSPAARAADLWRAGYTVEIVLSKAPAKRP